MTAVDTHLLLRALVDELARCGMRTAVTAPGSRNTPLIEAIVAEPRITAWSHIDERSAGFFAIGATRGVQRPVAVTVTSGSAVANLFPAVVEASEAHLPLIILTADRPAELRQIGAGQTIDQVKIFGSYVRFSAELDVYEATPERMRWVRSMACRAYLTSLSPEAGPVHLNIPLREPLVVDGGLPPDPTGGEGRDDARPWTWSEHPDPASEAPTAGPPGEDQPATTRAVVVVGHVSGPPALGMQIAADAARQALPVLADPLSRARHAPAAVANYDLILRDPGTADALRPELVVRFGDLPTSKPLRSWLAGLDRVEQIALHPHPTWPDPASRMSRRIIGTPVQMISWLGRFHGPPAWLDAWQTADAAVESAVGPLLDTDVLTEPQVARVLGTDLPRDATLFVASSMPIRDVEEFFPVRADPPRVMANRGANGIDGTVSSAFGVAATTDDPVVLLIGDVALAHDIGGLLTAKRHALKLTVVLINNDGGGIFNFLPIAAHPAAFTEHVATPHGLDFRHAAALYGLHHVAPTDVGGFTAALSHALQADSSTIIEVHTDRTVNRRLHAEIEQAARQALGGTAGRAV